MVELRDLRAFETLAAELHFGRAAVRLGVSQPTLSRHVRRLERELGVVLAHRTSRTVRLTDAGHELAERAARRPAPARAHPRGDARRGRGRLGDLARLGGVEGHDEHREVVARRARAPTSARCTTSRATAAAPSGALARSAAPRSSGVSGCSRLASVTPSV